MASTANNRVLITGASGMIGRQLCAAVQASGQGVVRAQVRDRTEAREKVGGVFDFALSEISQSDFTMMLEQDHRELTKGCHTVIHAAGLVHNPDAQYQEYEVINVRATQQLAEACVANQVKTLVFFSSSAVYGEGPFSNIDEEAPLKAKTPYAVSKATSEAFLKTLSGIPRIIVLRPSLVFGEGDRGNLIKMIREISLQRYKHIGKGETGKSVIYVKDIARALLLCLDKVPEGFHVFNVANPDPVTIHDLAEEIAKALELPKKIPSVPVGLLKFGVKVLEMFGKSPVSTEQVTKLTTETTCSIQKLADSTGFRPRTSLTRAIKSEIAWAKKNNLLS
ncbi:MAG: NAD-dependent epimerase/dehydratase family protein [Candidatus Obscuribacterales bacterium]|nr:NAD-dependent epimerase/dehydratase family protein [Candidatus Obscuribacterales bacterium]